MRKLTLGTAGLVAVLATAGGCYASGSLLLHLLRLDPRLLTWHAYLDYARVIALPQVRPYASRICLAGMVGFGLPAFAALAVLVPLFRSKQPALHGDARFANAADVRASGLCTSHGHAIVVGRQRGRLLRLGGQQSVVLAAPTRSGKGVGVVIPNLLLYEGSVVVLDIKQENFDLTSGWRERQGQSVYLFNPFAEDRRSHRWNPLHYVSGDSAFRVSDLMGIAAMLYPEGADTQRFWTGQARAAFLAFALYLFEEGDDARVSGFPGGPRVPTLGAVYRLCCGDGIDARGSVRMLASATFLGATASTAFAGLLALADDTFASVLGTTREPLNAWANPVLDAATSDDDFLLTDLRRRPMSIYVGIQPGKLAESRLILNLFFSQLINANTRELPQANPQLRHPCLLLLDEFTAIGKLDSVASAAGYLAGYNLRLLPVIQSVAQLDATYGAEVARTLLTNMALQVVFAPREQRDANDYSEMLCYTTLHTRTITRGRETTRSESRERRALMLPQELKALGQDRQVLLFEGLAHPVLCDKIRYHRDRRFTARLLPHASVPLLTV